MAGFLQIFNSNDCTTPGHYGPSQTALLLLDFHSLHVNEFGGPNAKAACKTAVDFRLWAKSVGVTIIHGLLDLDAEPYETCKDRQRFIDIIAIIKEKGGPEPPELTVDASDDERVFYRTPGYVNALLSPGLPEYLRQKGIRSLVICGLSTSGCVLRTTWPATDAEFVVTVLSDACADRDQALHDLIVGKLALSRAFVTTAKEFQEGWGEVQAKKRGSGLTSKLSGGR